eukprot:SAG25_NODE_344_length_9418_cov_328.220815_10_plen_607_part_01
MRDALALVLVAAGATIAPVPLNTATMKNFGHAIKNGHLVAQAEQTLFEHNCSAPPCTVTQMHCPSAAGRYDAIVRIYVDGEATPSIELSLLELANVGTRAQDGPPPRPPPAPAPPDPKVAPNYTQYYLGAQGATCAEACAAEGLTCSPHINTGFGFDKSVEMKHHLASFNASITSCIMDPRPWWASDQPGYVCGPDHNGNAKRCIGWHGIPAAGSPCGGSYPSQCRICRCLPATAADGGEEVEEGVRSSGSGTERQLTDGGPWGEALFGHTASRGGVYSTVRIPFGAHLRATITSPSASGTFWFIIRGVEAYPVQIGDVTLPAAARLKVHRINQSTSPLELVTLVSIPRGTAGALLNVKADAESGTYHYLEACMRATIDGGAEPMFLSSGGEDYFLSAFYFNEGEFKTPESGLTFYDGHGSLSAFKTHDRDPLLFADGLELVWRNGENTTGCGAMASCPNQYCSPTGGGGGGGGEEGWKGQALERRRDPAGYSPAHYEILTYVYEWQPQQQQQPQPLPADVATVEAAAAAAAAAEAGAEAEAGAAWLAWLDERGWLSAEQVAAAIALLRPAARGGATASPAAAQLAAMVAAYMHRGGGGGDRGGAAA